MSSYLSEVFLPDVANTLMVLSMRVPSLEYVVLTKMQPGGRLKRSSRIALTGHRYPYPPSSPSFIIKMRCRPYVGSNLGV